MKTHALAIAAVLPTLIGCGGPTSNLTAACHPTTHPWMNSPPEAAEGKVYGVGVASTSREASKRAQANAAETVRVRIEDVNQVDIVTTGSRRTAVAREYLATFVSQSLDNCHRIGHCLGTANVHSEVVCDHPDRLRQLEPISAEIVREAPPNTTLAVVPSDLRFSKWFWFR